MAEQQKGRGKPASPSRASKRYEDEASAFERLSEGVERATAAEQERAREQEEHKAAAPPASGAEKEDRDEA